MSEEGYHSCAEYEIYKGKNVAPLHPDVTDEDERFNLKAYLTNAEGCYAPLLTGCKIDDCNTCLFFNKDLAIEYLIEKGHVTKEVVMDMTLTNEIKKPTWYNYNVR